MRGESSPKSGEHRVYTLLILISAWLMRFGDTSWMSWKRTFYAPSKSAIIGIICSAFGRKRTDDISDLVALRFGTRTDQQGYLLQDFQTINCDRSDHGIVRKDFLNDAVFVVGLESEDRDFLEKIAKALKDPYYDLYLGNRACPPDDPLVLGIVEKDLEAALTEEPLHAHAYELKKRRKKAWISVRLILDCSPEKKTGIQKDVPVSFDPRRRRYTYRPILEKEVLIKNPLAEEADEMSAEDAFEAL